MTLPTPDNGLRRYARQTVLPEIGPTGQAALAQARVLVLGCGALGSLTAELLARAGAGFLRLVDRDVPELDNLHRQMLYDEDDVRERRPKAVAAAARLQRINSALMVEPLAVDANPANIASLVQGMTLVMDGLDHAETRYLLNDVCVRDGIPWIYGGVLGVAGIVVPVLPGQGPCLRCLWPEPPPPGSLPTCVSAGVLNAASAMVAAQQAACAIRLLVGHPPLVDHHAVESLSLDPWQPHFRKTVVRRQADCPCCHQRLFPFLEGALTAWVTALCGRNAVQVTPPSGAPPPDLPRLAERLARHGRVAWNGMLLDYTDELAQVTIFPDGRVMVHETQDLSFARTQVVRLLGG